MFFVSYKLTYISICPWYVKCSVVTLVQGNWFMILLKQMSILAKLLWKRNEERLNNINWSILYHLKNVTGICIQNWDRLIFSLKLYYHIWFHILVHFKNPPRPIINKYMCFESLYLIYLKMTYKWKSIINEVKINNVCLIIFNPFS